jgi:hypothetical protein
MRSPLIPCSIGKGAGGFSVHDLQEGKKENETKKKNDQMINQKKKKEKKRKITTNNIKEKDMKVSKIKNGLWILFVKL